MPSVLALGSGGSGQLGVGCEVDKLGVASPCRFDILPPPSSLPTRLAGGANHSLMLFDDGNLYAAGDNSSGACGHQIHQKLLTFHKINLPNVQGFKDIAATWTTSVLVTSDGAIFVCGEGSRGELGLGLGITSALTPVELIGFPPVGYSILQVAASFRHVVVMLLESGSGRQSFWGWGVGRHGELGPDAESLPGGLVWEPSQICGHVDWHWKSSMEAKRITCGRDFSYILESGEANMHTQKRGFALGSSRHGIVSSALPTLTEPVVPHATWSSVYLHLPQSGGLVVYGKDRNIPVVTQGFPEVSLLETGSEHAVAKLKEGPLIAWGWNEHLNCGKNDKQDQPQVASYHVLDKSDQCYPLGCGCATTFYVKVGPLDQYSPEAGIVAS